MAVQIDMNLERVRDLSAKDIDYELQLELDRPPDAQSPDARAARVLELALRDVELHDWSAKITDDAARIHLSGGSVSLDLGLSRAVMDYIAGPDGR